MNKHSSKTTDVYTDINMAQVKTEAYEDLSNVQSVYEQAPGNIMQNENMQIYEVQSDVTYENKNVNTAAEYEIIDKRRF